MKTILLAFALSFSFSALAGSFSVLRVTNDQDTDVTTLSIETGADGSAVRLKKVTTGNGIVSNTSQNSLDEARRGAVLFKEGNYDVIRLKLTDRFEPVYGGPITLDYLVNGVTGSRRNIGLEAVQEGGKWVIKLNGKVVTKAHVISNKILGKVVGVSQVKF